MTTILFLAEWAVRSSILILTGALLLWALRMKDPSIRLAAWTAVLCGSLAIPVMTTALPKIPVTVMRATTAPRVAAAPASKYLAALGTVTASTVTIRPLVDGQLVSVSFKEGETVQAGQVVASIDPRPYRIQLERAEEQLVRDQAQLDDAGRRERSVTGSRVDRQLAEGNVKIDRTNIQNAQLQMTYTKILTPISGVAGMRLAEPGNIVRATDATGIVTVAQLQPIPVVFTLPEDFLPQVRALLKTGVSPVVEAWNRDNTPRISTGHLSAIDNQIDRNTGTVKLKADFDNKDGALFPNRFVNVRLFVNAQ
jgi:multidrug efflux system membrane fusion protein